MAAKIEDLLQISKNIGIEERRKSPDLWLGYEEQEDLWEIIVKYTGDILQLKDKYPQIEMKPLMNQYAIIRVSTGILDALSQETCIDYIEKPKLMYYELETGKRACCLNTVYHNSVQLEGLTGKGVLLAVIDSGIDITDAEFRNLDGTTKIECIYDQNQKQEYDRSRINEALNQKNNVNIPAFDPTGHGTSVAKIACGNHGVAPDAELLFVKMRMSSKNTFPRTTQLMEAVDYVLEKAIAVKKPVAINISFGNNYGDHAGTSMLETYLNDASIRWKNVICVGSGNEGLAGTHTDGKMKSGEVQMIELGVSIYETSINIQIWKEYWDDMDVELITPSGKNLGKIDIYHRIGMTYADGTRILTYYGASSYYNTKQEIYIDLAPMNDYIAAGSWWIKLTAKAIKSGNYDIWIPSLSSLNYGTGFLHPSVTGTITVPSTAEKVITVGAYDAKNNQPVGFSGRGKQNTVKPDLVAPGVEIALSESKYVTGTSFATPFVTGSAALLMQWGITDGRDPYLYGEKIKSYLIKGAKQFWGMENSNLITGWGALCVRESLPM